MPPDSRRFLSAVLAMGFLLPARAESSAPGKAEFDATLQEALKVWHVPGLAVVIVRDDKVTYLEGLGVRRVGEKDPVTPDTIFPLASCTKAFTATAIGLLVAEGKADWDDPVRRHLPWFRLSDPLADREVRLRDLLCHRTGLARQDLLWYRAPWSVEESVRRLAFLEQHTSFRSQYEYNNLGYLAAGLAIERAAGVPWQDFMKKKLLDPLGMKGAVFTSTDALKTGKAATPHTRGEDGKWTPIAWYPDEKQIRASGSLKASARNLGPWLRFQLNKGTLDGKCLLPDDILAETHTPQIPEPVDRARARLSGTTQASYGLGWHVTDYRGHLVFEHGGANDGFRARVILLPRSGIGIALLANVDESAFLAATGDALVDLLLGLEKRDWHGYQAERVKARQAETKEKRRKQAASRQPHTKPSRELAAYAGKYHEPAYGDLEVVREGRELRLQWSGFAVPLRHFHYDTFEVREAGAPLEGELALFHLGDSAKVAEVRFLNRTFRRVKP